MTKCICCRVDRPTFSYLGLPSKQKKKNSKPLLDKIEKQLNSWIEKLLSIGGRITLIKAVLRSLPIYYMYLFRHPINIINAIEQIQRKFCWGISNDKRGVCWISLDQMLASKDNGRMGIGSIGGC